MHVALLDGRAISIPLAWFPRLYQATPQQRQHWELIGQGTGAAAEQPVPSRRATVLAHALRRYHEGKTTSANRRWASGALGTPGVAALRASTATRPPES